MPTAADSTVKNTRLKQLNVAPLRKFFQGRRRRHDPMLVFNMSIFNWENGWDRILKPCPTHENG